MKSRRNKVLKISLPDVWHLFINLNTFPQVVLHQLPRCQIYNRFVHNYPSTTYQQLGAMLKGSCKTFSVVTEQVLSPHGPIVCSLSSHWQLFFHTKCWFCWEISFFWSLLPSSISRCFLPNWFPLSCPYKLSSFIFINLFFLFSPPHPLPIFFVCSNIQIPSSHPRPSFLPPLRSFATSFLPFPTPFQQAITLNALLFYTVWNSYLIHVRYALLCYSQPLQHFLSDTCLWMKSTIYSCVEFLPASRANSFYLLISCCINVPGHDLRFSHMCPH